MPPWTSATAPRPRRRPRQQALALLARGHATEVDVASTTYTWELVRSSTKNTKNNSSSADRADEQQQTDRQQQQQQTDRQQQQQQQQQQHSTRAHAWRSTFHDDMDALVSCGNGPT
jgi:hypothetical protein